MALTATSGRAAVARNTQLRPLVAPALWALVVVAGAVLGRRLYEADPLVRVGAAPLVGSDDLRLSLRLVPALALAAAGVAWGPSLARALAWRTLLAGAWLGSCAWAVALAAGDGWSALTAPLTSRYEYLGAVDRVGAPGPFLDGFVAALPSFPTHVKGHPPGLVLLLAGLDDVGLGGAAVAAALVIGAGALAAPAALVALRALAGEATARAAAPFLVLAPAALWIATSGDALFLGVAACGIAAFAVAATRGGIPLAVAAGLVLGGSLFLSYSVVPLGLVVLAIAWRTRAWPALVAAAAGVAAVAAGFAVAGFWWFDGLAATRDLYVAGVSTRRPHADFAVINLAAFALAIGPAAVAGLLRLRDAGAWVLCGGGLAAVALADASGLSKGETERIWLPFVPWLLVATAALGGSRRWLAAQVVLALVLQATVRSPW